MSTEPRSPHALSSALASGRDLGLHDARNHGSWQALLAHELGLPASERVDFVSIVTPNHVHYEVAKAFAEAGIHVVCEKPRSRACAPICTPSSRGAGSTTTRACCCAFAAGHAAR